jgi:hypothetical protein
MSKLTSSPDRNFRGFSGKNDFPFSTRQFSLEPLPFYQQPKTFAKRYYRQNHLFPLNKNSDVPQYGYDLSQLIQ